MNRSPLRHVATSLGLALTLASMNSQAAPVSYSFSTGTVIAASSNPDVAALLGTNATVTGSLVYDTAGATYAGNTGTLGLGGNAELYLRATSDIVGSVGGFSFSDATGGIALSNDNPLPFPYRDTLRMGADLAPAAGSNQVPSSVPRNLVFFETGGYRLHNVRMLWLSGLGGAGDFLNDKNLPAELPTAISGRLALDFVLSSDPGNLANTPYYSRTVFFDNLVLTPVPEPSTYALALTGLLAVGFMARARRRQG